MRTAVCFFARIGLFTLLAAALGACLDTVGVPCGSGYCPAGFTCYQDKTCRSEPGCGNGVLEPELDEACDDGNNTSRDGCSADCQSNEQCGNNFTDKALGEMCDDGNNVHQDGCSADCRSNETCGNGFIDTDLGEICDDGNNISGDGCRVDCRSNETCGNGLVDEARGEICDDGNNNNRDACPSICKYDCEHHEEGGYRVCYDTLTWEEARHACRLQGSDLVIIDDTSENSRVRALLPKRFWIGLSDAAQEGNFSWVDNSTLTNPEWAAGEPNDIEGEDCVEVLSTGFWNDVPCDNQLAFVCEACTDCSCGNGQVDPDEECDDGNASPGDGCDAACRLEPECGNQRVEPGEECDDGNASPGDGCDAACRLEPECGNQRVEPGEECDDGNHMLGDGCDAGCRLESVPENEPNEDGSPEVGDSFEGNDFSTVNANGPYEGDVVIAATLEPVGDEDVFMLVNREPEVARVRFSTHDAAFGQGVPCYWTDTVLVVRDTQGDVVALNDDYAEGWCSMIELDIEPGETVYAHVLAFGDASPIPDPGYGLAIDFP